MSIDEIVAGQKTGLIDGAENNLLAYESFKHFEVFSHFSGTEHSMAPDVLIFSKQIWDGLSEADRQIIRECAKQSVPMMRRYWNEKENAARKNLSAAGTIFVNGCDKKPFQDAMRPVYDKFVTTERQKSLLRKIQDLQ